MNERDAELMYEELLTTSVSENKNLKTLIKLVKITVQIMKKIFIIRFGKKN
ncbi:hypothetical protein BOVMAS36_16320 [Streptococcus uberis]